MTITNENKTHPQKFEIGLYSFAELTPDPATGVMISPAERLANLLESIRLLANGSRLFAGRCIAGIEADEEQCRRYAEMSPSVGTSLNPYIGYEKAAEVIKAAMREGRTIREIVLEQGLLTEEETIGARKVLSAAALTYVAATAAAIWELIYWLMQLGLLGGDE